MSQDPNQPPQQQVTQGGQPAAGPPAQGATPFGPPIASTTPQVYAAMQQGYFGPLNSPSTPAMPHLDDPTMQALAQRIQSLQQSHQVLNGSKPPDPNSVFARQTAHLSATEIASQVGKETWQQMVVQPFQDFVKTWQTDWKAGLLETLGGGALVAGVIGLEALTGGAATPFIFAAGAALVAPSMIQAWGNEMQNPTDANLVKALVSTSTGILAVGVPVKWANGMSMGRNSLSFALRAKRDLVSEEAMATSVLSGRKDWRDLLNFRRPAQEQLDTLADRGNEMRAQFKQYKVDLTDKSVVDLLNRTDVMDGHRKAWHAAKNDPQKRAELEAEMKKYGQEAVLPLRIHVAANYGFFADNKLKHIPLGPTEKTSVLPAQIQRDAQTRARSIMGHVRQLGKMQNLTDLSAHSLVEQAGRRGEIKRTVAEMSNHHDELVKTLKLTDEQITEVELGMEDPAAWEKLSGEQQLYGQYRATMHGAMTMGQLRTGAIPVAIAGYLPRMWTGVEETDHTSGVRDVFAWLRGSMISNSRMYKAVVDAQGDVKYYEKPRAQLMAEERNQTAVYKAQRPLRDYMAQNEEAVRKERAMLAGWKRHRSRNENLKTAAGDAKAAELQAKIDRHWDTLQVTDPKLAQLAHMESNAFESVQRLAPSMRKLVTGHDLFRASMASYAFRMEEMAIRTAVQTHANGALEHIGAALGKKVSVARYGIEMQQPEFKAAHALPDFMPETAFGRGVDASKGYKQVFRAIGRPGDLHHQPALFARDELADELHKIMDSAYSSHDVYTGVLGALYKTVQTSKRFIMATPFWHAMNVGGRLAAFVLDDPVGATTALKTVWGKGEHLMDPEARAALEERARQAGITHANQFEVTNLMHRNLRNNDAQPTWKHVMRSMAGPLPHLYQDMLEGGFWKMVDDMQLAGFQLAEHKMRLSLPKGTPEAEVSRLAAEYANNLVGMVNPLYMNKVYRHARNLIWFAPSYWATYTRMLLSVPGADRLSSFLAHYRGGEFVRWGNVPLKAVSDAGRRELTRMQRSWTVTYLTTGVVAADMLNVMLGGRHLWENDQGRQFDINVDHFAEWSKGLPVVGGLSPGGPSPTKSGAMQHAYISSMPFFRQAADVMNALGMGHDWGLAHQLTDENWKQADGLHKGLMAMGALADGVRREAANKTGGVPQAIYGAATGEEMSARLGQGVQRQIKGPIGSWDALLALVPGGMTLERFMSQEEQAAQRAGGQAPDVGQQLQQFAPKMASSLLQQFTGFPSMYHMGPESPPVDDSKMLSWYKERNSLHDALQSASKQLFMGDMTPLGYTRKRQQLLDRLVELDKMTFGDSTPGAALANARANIAQQLGLDNLGLSDSDWYARYQTFQQIWDATVQAASPEVRSAWWEHEHSQWTDADYLAWEAREMKKAIAAAVDGQGGQYIAAYENQIASLNQLPLTTAERQKIEESDPYYYTYRQMIKNMSRTSPLGAFINAFTSPFSETYILEQGLTPEEQQQAALLAPGTASLIKPETATALAGEAKQIASSPEVGAAGGQATASPEFTQNLQEAVAEAENA